MLQNQEHHNSKYLAHVKQKFTAVRTIANAKPHCRDTKTHK